MIDGGSENVLIDEVLIGNKKAFIQLVRQYEGLVLHIVTPLIGINEDREDICQDVFIKVYEKLNTFQFKSKLSTWIGNIAYNTSINFLKKKRNILLSDLVSTNEEASFLEEAGGYHSNPEQIIIKKENIHELNRNIDKLPELQKSILLLFYKDELNVDEISNIMEMPANTIKSHLFRARKSLKELLIT